MHSALCNPFPRGNICNIIFFHCQMHEVVQWLDGWESLIWSRHLIWLCFVTYQKGLYQFRMCMPRATISEDVCSHILFQGADMIFVMILTHSCTQMLPVTTADLLYVEASPEHVWEQCLVQGHLDSDCKEMWDFNPVTCALSHLLSKIPAYFL